MWRATVLALAWSLAPGTSNADIIGGCQYDTAAQQFRGKPIEQAGCLLRAVKKKGAGAVPQPLPEWINSNVGQPVSLTPEQLGRYLAAQGIDAKDIGGPIHKAEAADVRYFVIHDTSSPEIDEAKGFPTDLDKPSYSGNRLASWNGNIKNQVNLIISRDGQSRAYRRWGEARPSPAIKLEMQRYSAASKKRFVHVENVQPRLKPESSFAWVAPTPGFSPKQEERLALAYIAASIQAGTWLLPAYHFNIDEGLPDGHDDPQNTDLASWVKQIAALEAAIKQ
ncbi:MAG: hypothetical protein DI537_17600 [Stutzerimonas stutzeri]|nr:MAG: hypothetical protein DI537_17600 [Stutzerimonas stutzeri]